MAAIGALCWIFAAAMFLYARTMRTPATAMLAVFGYVGAGFLLAALAARMAPEAARRASLAAAVVVTALLFSLVHQGQLAQAWAPLLMLFLVGIALTLTRALMRSLAASWLLHASYNGTLFLMLLLGTHGFRNLDRISP